MHNFDLKNRTAIVTGGAQGFGYAIVKRFLESGANVIIWDIDKNECEDQDGVYVNPSNEFSVNLSLLATGQFTLNAWFDENVNLWTIGVNNDGATMPDGSFPNYALKFELRNSAISSEPLVSAFYVGEDLASTETLFNSDFSGGGSSSICDWQQNTDFRNTVESIGLLPQGDYSLTLTLYPQNTAPSEEGAVEWCNFGSNPSVTEVLSNNLVSTIELTEPPELANVSEMYPWFRWYSPGFRQGVNINYRLIVSQYNPLLHGSRLDAINDLQLRYFDSKWDYPGLSNILESGESQQISVKFPSGDKVKSPLEPAAFGSKSVKVGSSKEGFPSRFSGSVPFCKQT